MFLSHKHIKPNSIELRAYQENVAQSAMRQPTLVVLPTGMGKTVIALRVIAEMVDRGKILLLAPTKPLVEQHYKFLNEFLVLDAAISVENDEKKRRRFDSSAKIQMFTGETSPAERTDGWKNAGVIVSTPQVIENDIISGRITLDGVSLIVFDEAHRASGDYSYVFIAEQYSKLPKENRLALGMTASPGSTAARINEVCKNIGAENVEIRTENDPDVKPYVQNVYVEWLEVEMPEDVRRVSNLLRDAMNARISALQSAGFVPGHVRPERVSVRDLLNAQAIIQSKIRESSPHPPAAFFQAVAMNSAAMKISHAIEMAETQGIPALRSYLERLKEDQSKGAAMLRSDPKFSDAVLIAKQLNIDRVDHPKVERLTGILLDQIGRKPDSRVIVFSQYRDTVEMLLGELAKNQAIRAVRFIGQASRGEENGMTQKKQMETIEKFRANEFNVLVSTSIGEEGLDIPQVDLVVFYEPVPSEIRSIQRRGRTGRKRPGRVVVMMTKGTRDEAYYWSGKSKEQRMKSELEVLREQMRRQNIVRAFRQNEAETPQATPSEKKGQLTLGEFERIQKPQAASSPAEKSTNPHQVRIITDTREFNSGVARDLLRAGAFVESKQLEVGDYILSDRCCAERKESNDFVQSIIDGRLFEQMIALKNAYRRPIVVIEGADIVTVRNMNPMSIYSAVASISVDFGIPILQTRDAKETANLLYAIARREQTDEKRDVAIRGEKGQMSLAERQQFIIESLPDISSVLAKRLLSQFGSVKRVMAAKPEALQRVEGIGPVTAEKITKAINEQYEPERKE